MVGDLRGGEGGRRNNRLNTKCSPSPPCSFLPDSSNHYFRYFLRFIFVVLVSQDN